MEQVNYRVVFEKLNEILKLEAQETADRYSDISSQELREVEELSRFVAELNEAPVSTYTTA